MLRLDRIRDVITDELMLSDIGDVTSLADFVNEALGLWAMHSWNYLMGKRATLTFADGTETGVPGADAVELPEGCTQVLRVWPKGNRYRQFGIVQREDFWAAQDAPTTNRVMSTEDRPSADSERRGESTMWLLLPVNDLATSPLLVIYNVAPKRVHGPDDIIDLPYRYESTFLAFIRAMARGRYDSDRGTVEDEMERFFLTRIWAAGIALDGTEIPVDPPRMGPAGEYLRSGELLFGQGYDPDYYPR